MLFIIYSILFYPLFTGLISANSIIDTILYDSYFIIGHLHYVLSLGAIFTTLYTLKIYMYCWWIRIYLLGL